MKDLIRLYSEHNLPKRKAYHNRREFFCAKQSENETPEDIWRRLLEIKKECNFNNIEAGELLISKTMTGITCTNYETTWLRKKVLKKKKTIELIKQNTYDKKQKDNIKRGPYYNNRKTSQQKKPIQRINKFGTWSKTKFSGTRPFRICNTPNWSPLHKCPALESNCNNCGKKGDYARACRQRKTILKQWKNWPKKRYTTKWIPQQIRGSSHQIEKKLRRKTETLHSRKKNKRDMKRICNWHRYR